MILDENFVLNTGYQIPRIAFGTDGTLLAESTVTAGQDGKATVSLPVTAITGVHDIYFSFNGAVYSFDSWKFEK